MQYPNLRWHARFESVKNSLVIASKFKFFLRIRFLKKYFSRLEKKNTRLYMRGYEKTKKKLGLDFLQELFIDLSKSDIQCNTNLEKFHSDEQTIEEEIQEREHKVVSSKESYLELKARGVQRATRLKAINETRERLQTSLEKENEIEKELVKNLLVAEKQLLCLL